MEAYGCFLKIKYICYEASHVFHKVFFRFAPRIEPLINTTDIWKLMERMRAFISLNIFIMKLTMFSISFP